MRKGMRYIFLLLLIASSTVICGCETTKGLAQGITKDSANAWQGIKHADAWIKDNLW